MRRRPHGDWRSTVTVQRSELIRIRPKGTSRIEAEILISYSCGAPPRVEAVDIVGINQLGFFISSQYEVRAIVDGGDKERCELASCQDAIRYKYKVRVSSILAIGLGFGFGGGTGTFGWKSRSMFEHVDVTSECICCDGLPPNAARSDAARASQLVDSVAAFALLFALLGATTSIAAVQLELFTWQNLEVGALSLMILLKAGTTLAAVWRAVRLLRVRKKEGADLKR